MDGLVSVGYDEGFGGVESNGGLRFLSVGIDQGATISTAKITVNVINVTGTPDLIVYGVDADAAAAFADPGNLPSAATRTTASTAFAPTGTGSAEIDVKAIVQEIVNRVGYAGGAIAFVIDDNAGAGTNYAEIEDIDAAGSNEAQLDVTYSTLAVPVMYHHQAEKWRKR